MQLLCPGCVPSCWRQATVAPIHNGPSSSSVVNYQPISITPALSKVLEPLVSVHRRYFMEHSGVLPTTKFAYRKGLRTCDALFCVSHILQRALEIGQETRIVQIHFSAAFDRVNLQGILYKLCFVGVLKFLCCVYWHNLYQLDHSMLWCTVAGVNWLTLCQKSRCAVFGAVTVPLVHLNALKLIGYAVDSTLIAVACAILSH